MVELRGRQCSAAGIRSHSNGQIMAAGDESIKVRKEAYHSSKIESSILVGPAGLVMWSLEQALLLELMGEEGKWRRTKA